MSVVAKQVKSKSVTVGLVSPGMVDTDMMRALPVKLPLMPAEESARMVSAVIAGLTPDTSGKFLSHTGEEEPW
jgi:NAD(P)-dependent dehydrogenase (short-subunit alcohol dehydrogenase family)